MKLTLRSWATPLTFATFLVVGVTGLAQFFHLGGTLSRTAHEWIGLAIIAAVGAHVALNWRPFMTYLKRPLALSIMGAGVLATVLSSVTLPSAGNAPQLSPGMVFGALQNAPLSAVAEVAGKDGGSLIAALQQAGYPVTDTRQSIAEVADGDAALARAMLGTALARAD